MNKILFIFLFLFCWTFLSLAQTNIDKAGQRIKSILQSDLNLDTAITNKLCGRGCIFAKFNFDKNGKLLAFASSKDTLGLAKQLYKCISSLHNDKTLVKILKKTNTNFVLPVIYDFDIGCLYPQINSDIETKEDRYRHILSYYKQQINTDFYLTNLFDMLNFNGKKSYAIKCILLNPITIGTMKPITY